ncbi:MAG: hypothetical protein ACQKBV_10615, partial [Puniceicoccales bacterium]
MPELPEDTNFTALENPPAEGADPLTVYVGFPCFLFAVIRGETTTATWYQMEIRDEGYFDLTVHLLMPEPQASDEEFVAGSAEILRHIHL